MSRSRQIAVTVLGAIAAIAVILTLVKVVPSRVQPAVASAPNHTAIARGEVTTDSAPPEIDQDAIAALERMGSYLRKLEDFQLKADVVTEDVRTDGQKVQIIRSVSLVARRPNRLFADIKNDRKQRMFFYDGKNFTLYAPRPQFYATVPAPATIEKLADDLEDKYDIELPLVDLFRWGTPESDVSAITSAVDLGPSAINGVTCEQYGFRQDGLDWQLWIQLGQNPLPCRIVLTTLTDEARPQHTATYSWNLAPSFDDNTFVFRAPTGAKPIPIAQVPVVASSSNTARQ
jgi:hypothetical protein